MPHLYVIDGAAFSNLRGFFKQVSRILIPRRSWGRNLNAFNDILRGGFGTPTEGFVLVWKHSELSRQRLGADFDTLVEILLDHGPGGEQAEDRVDLVLE